MANARQITDAKGEEIWPDDIVSLRRFVTTTGADLETIRRMPSVMALKTEEM